MKRALAAVAAMAWLSAFPPCLPADGFVKGVLHVEGGYRYGHNVPDADVVYEWWFGKKTMTQTSTGWNFDFGEDRDVRFVWDQEKMRLLVVDLSGKSYVEVALARGLASQVDSATSAWLSQFKVDGTVERTAQEKTVQGRACDEYRVREWMIRKDDRFFDRERTILATREVPFDWRMADEMFFWVASFINPPLRYLSALKKKEGFILLSRDSVFEGGSRVTFSFEVLEIREEKAPQGIYDAPPGFTRNERLTIEDLFRIRGIFYLYFLY